MVCRQYGITVVTVEKIFEFSRNESDFASHRHQNPRSSHQLSHVEPTTTREIQPFQCKTSGKKPFLDQSLHRPCWHLCWQHQAQHHQFQYQQMENQTHVQYEHPQYTHRRTNIMRVESFSYHLMVNRE